MDHHLSLSVTGAIPLRSRTWSVLARPSLLVGLVYILLLLFFVVVRHESALSFVHLGTVWSAHQRAGSWGYDGQFYYQIARNPLGAAPYMDNAPYRYQHILYGLLAWMLSLGQPVLLPYVLLLINLLAIIGSVEILSLLLRREGISPWFSLGLGLYYGQAVGLTFDTTEPLTCFLLCLGLWFFARKHVVASAAWMGLATLSRETAVIFPLCMAAFLLWQHQGRNALVFILLGVLPLAVWLLGLALHFGQTGLTFTPPFEHFPFAGIFVYRNAPHKFWFLVLLLLVPTLLSLGFLVWDLIRRHLHPMALIWAMNLGMLMFLSRFSYIEMVSAGRISIVVVLAGMVYATQTRNRTLLWCLQIYALTFLVYFLGTLVHLDSFLA